jgi:hypothetical protein
MLYRSFGTSLRADRPSEISSHNLSGDEASPGKRPETPTMATGIVESPYVSAILGTGYLITTSEISESGSVVCTGLNWKVARGYSKS